MGSSNGSRPARVARVVATAPDGSIVCGEGEGSIVFGATGGPDGFDDELGWAFRMALTMS